MTACVVDEKPSRRGPYRPTVILHGGAGSISRASLPPALYARYHASLLQYLTETRRLLDTGATALDAACLAVTRFEDDVLFNCGRGAVFTEQGTIEMEASVMVCSAEPSLRRVAGDIKRGAAVSLVRNTRHPILLAKEVLTAADQDAGSGGTGTMHCHLSGRDVEEWGWKEKGLEKKPARWFWTQKRWDEHRRGLHHDQSYTFADLLSSVDPVSPPPTDVNADFPGDMPSQGTVGAVCLDSWGSLAVATSTGGLTNKKAGRIGDTPTIGAGFYAESWHEDATPAVGCRGDDGTMDVVWDGVSSGIRSCLHIFEPQHPRPLDTQVAIAPPRRPCASSNPYRSPMLPQYSRVRYRHRHRAVAMSGTGNGDSFLRTDAVRTAAAMCRFSKPRMRLSEAITRVAGPDGELQLSAGDRWGRTGEGQGGIIGIEVVSDDVEDVESHELGHLPQVDPPGAPSCCRTRPHTSARVTFDFNCGGLFRAFYEMCDDGDGQTQERPRVMVFRDDY